MGRRGMQQKGQHYSSSKPFFWELESQDQAPVQADGDNDPWVARKKTTETTNKRKNGQNHNNGPVAVGGVGWDGSVHSACDKFHTTLRDDSLARRQIHHATLQYVWFSLQPPWQPAVGSCQNGNSKKWEN